MHGFEGYSEGQVSSAYLIEQYQAAAAHFSAVATDAPLFWTCDNPGSATDASAIACGESSVLRLAQRAWRRPMEADEVERRTAFYRSNVAQWGLSDGIVLTVQGVMMTPQFLYRVETTEPDKKSASGKKPEQLSAFELASRLSYFLWDSMPDATLFEAAANGKLSTKKQIEQQAWRMLQDDRAREAVVHFHSQWLDLDSVHDVNADMDTYQPTYLPEAFDLLDPDEELFVEDLEEVWSAFLIGTRAGQVREVELFVEKTIFEGEGSLFRLMTDNHGYVTTISSEEELPELGTDRIYGITSDDLLPGPTYEMSLDDGNLVYDLRFTPAVFPADQRAGLLTMPAVLTRHSHPVHPAPILRGVFIKERMLCETIGQPPDGAESEAPADSLIAESTNRERTEIATASAECTGCHSTINPLGFAFENFDTMGGWRDTDNGLPVDASGTLEITGASFSSPVELANHLAQSTRLHDCYALQWTRYGLGTADPDPDTIADIQADFLKNEGDILQLIVDITTSDAFRYRTGGAQ